MRFKHHRLIRPFAPVRAARATPGRAILGRTWLLAALLVTAFAALTASAYANAPNPKTIKVDSQTVSGGNVTVTVSGTWTWDKSVPSGGQADCNDSRIGVGVAVGWGDNKAHSLKPKVGKELIYVGDAEDNWVHSVTEGKQTVDGPFKPSPKTVMEEMTGETPEKFGMQGISPPPGVHAAVPTKADAEKWVSNCGPTASNSNPSQPTKGYPNGTWGPISHTYTTPGTYTICPVMYDPHGNRVGGVAGNPKEIIAGGTGHNNDNSVESNNNANPCVTTTVVRVPTCNAGIGNTTAAFNSIPLDYGKGCKTPPSLGFEAQQTNEFGGDVVLDPTPGNKLKSLTVGFQSFACESGAWNEGQTNPCNTTPGGTFTIPASPGGTAGITAHIYEVTGSPGSEVLGGEIASATNTEPIPYRPSADPACTFEPPSHEWQKGSQYKDATTGECVNSISDPIKFTFAGEPVLPAKVVWTVSFNTSQWGDHPFGEPTTCSTGPGGCPYDSLNVGVKKYENSPYAGKVVPTTPGDIVVYWRAPNNSCPGCGPTGIYNEWPEEYIPLGTIITTK